MGSKTAVTHKDDLALRKPPNGLEHALSGPVCEFFDASIHVYWHSVPTGREAFEMPGSALNACLPWQWCEKA